jgi:60 kDa SS-A/Ro ribonucleoprotein
VDAFIIYTDNETNANSRPIPEVLREYRRVMEIDAKLIVVAMTATRFSISDPLDQNSLDIVGFDTDTPEAISTFITDM